MMQGGPRPVPAPLRPAGPCNVQLGRTAVPNTRQAFRCRSRGSPCRAKVVGRCAEQAPTVPDPARDETVVLQRTDADREIKALGDQIDVAVGELGLDRYARMGHEEIQESRGDPQPPEGAGKRQAGVAPRFTAIELTRGVVRVVHRLQDERALSR